MPLCEKCGHFGIGLNLTKEFDWKKALSKELVSKLEQNQFKTTNGTIENGVKYTTLYLAKLGRVGLASALTLDNLLTHVDFVYSDSVVPVLDILNKNFNILGCLAKPSVIELALTDLHVPFDIFCFVTVEDVPNLYSKLKELDLEGLTMEGSCSTLKG